MTKDFLQITDFTRDEAIELLKFCKRMKDGEVAPKPLEGKTAACIFHKPSLRTRISFEVGINQLGGNSLYITDKEIELGVRESIYDVANVMSRYVGLIMIRTFDHKNVEELAEHASVPVVNGLTDLTHPCQVMGDIFTYYEKTGKFEDLTIAFLGDGNNVFNSFLNLSCLFKMNLRLGTSPKTLPNQELMEKAKKAGRSKIEIHHNPKDAVSDADIIYTDVWASMGQKHLAEEKAKLLSEFQVNNDLLNIAKPGVMVMHCLPANRGQEITDEVMDGPHSVVFDEAENRLHIQKAIMATLLENNT
ncbi:MAG: ornithine carbamoyltransferase [candidate division Zixibacteria bacterium]|nr:ornithine carbamoyltransferase [candidate division Zixibacteria bacterium]NIR64142.1 ornithine carbamoyltransferase [candidate division Zixibacteria bacterium]NIS15568.1 ornithine carbamoyltransferase [candidate division Zixibacteria bacterium]NIS46044.1 ornithine carbamoyltransferase [candidate division Zixibacteria bacterium]NIT52093.1 ornithine carbamoyltransferase [candidate division Zixibacteria bacterium]